MKKWICCTTLLLTASCLLAGCANGESASKENETETQESLERTGDKEETFASDTEAVSMPGENVTGEAMKDVERYSDEKMGYITGFIESGGQSFAFDYAEWGEDKDEPNGFRIENPEKEEVTYQVDENTEYVIVLSARLYAVDKENFTKHLEELESQNQESVIPFWIREKNGVVQRIYEQYVP